MIETQHTTLLQKICEFMIHYKVIFKSIHPRFRQLLSHRVKIEHVMVLEEQKSVATHLTGN